jgi:hypothetical protein
MRSFNLICQFLLAILLLSFQWATAAQKGEPQKKEAQKDDEAVIIDRYPLILIDAQVISRTTGLVVSDLTHKDFAISENNIPQVILSWQRQSVPLSLLILVEAVTEHNNSHPIDSRIKALKSSLARDLRDKDEASIMVMAERPIVLQNFTSNKQLINAALDRVSQYKRVRDMSAEKRFAIALEEAAKQARSVHSPEARHAIVLISAMPKATSDRVVLPEDVVRAIVESTNIFCWDSPVHFTPYFSDVEKYSFDRVSIPALIELTGGEVVRRDWKSFLERLRERYRISYAPVTEGRKGEMVRIKLELTPSVKRGRRGLVLIYPRSAVIPPSK